MTTPTPLSWHRSGTLWSAADYRIFPHRDGGYVLARHCVEIARDKEVQPLLNICERHWQKENAL